MTNDKKISVFACGPSAYMEAQLLSQNLASTVNSVFFRRLGMDVRKMWVDFVESKQGLMYFLQVRHLDFEGLKRGEPPKPVTIPCGQLFTSDKNLECTSLFCNRPIKSQVGLIKKSKAQYEALMKDYYDFLAKQESDSPAKKKRELEFAAIPLLY